MILILEMPREKEWVWEHYYQDQQKCNSTNYGARCKYCTQDQLKRIRTKEQHAVTAGVLSACRSDSLLLSEGMSIFVTVNVSLAEHARQQGKL